jgi:hypothetical protein
MLGLLIGIPCSQADSGGLFEAMVGTWIGKGECIQHNSGRRIRIEARAISTLQGPRLISHNEITETPESGPSKSYVRDYWIQPTTVPGGFELGQNNLVTSQGRFEDGTLEVEQTFGGASGLVIRSRTQFNNHESVYLETTWHGERELARTSIRYVRN